MSGQTSFFHPLRDSASQRTYTRYTPAECLSAIAHYEVVARKASQPFKKRIGDQDDDRDTILTGQREIAMACVRHLSIESVSVYDLPDLARLYWFSQDTTALHQTLARRAALDKTDSARVLTTQQLLTRFLNGPQRDPVFVTQVLLPTLDSLTSLDAQRVRLQAYTRLAWLAASSRVPEATEAFAAWTDLAINEFSRMPAIVQATVVDSMGPLFRAAVMGAAEIGATDRANRLLDIARSLLPKLPDGAQHVKNAESIVRMYGMLAPPLVGDFTFGISDEQKTSATFPRNDRWSLITPLFGAEQNAQMYRYLKEVFADSLDLVFFMGTTGYWRPHGPLSPNAEAELAYDFLSRRWNIPGILLVEDQEFRTLPDGRRVGEGLRAPALYKSNGIIVDSKGTIRAIVNSRTIGRLDVLLRSLMSSDPSASPK